MTLAKQDGLSSPENLEKLIQASRGAIHNVLRKFQIPWDEHEDLAQDTVLRMLKYDSNRRRDAPFSAWAAINAKSVCMDYYRNRAIRFRLQQAAPTFACAAAKRTGQVSDGDRRTLYGRQDTLDMYEYCLRDPDALTDPYQEILRKEFWDAVTSAILRIPEPYRETVRLYFVQELTDGEIEGSTGLCRKTVRSRVFRQKPFLRVALAEYAPPEDRPTGRRVESNRKR
jgi:RNA polymerase sigma factor (sigma-70 family)